VVCVLTIAAYVGAIGEHLWFGKIFIGAHVLHPMVLIFAYPDH